MQGLLKSVITCLCRIQIRKFVNEFFYCKSENWMQTTEYDENVLNNWKLPNGTFIVKMKKR